jgi:hypothetical protein
MGGVQGAAGSSAGLGGSAGSVQLDREVLRKMLQVRAGTERTCSFCLSILGLLQKPCGARGKVDVGHRVRRCRTHVAIAVAVIVFFADADAAVILLLLLLRCVRCCCCAS